MLIEGEPEIDPARYRRAILLNVADPDERQRLLARAQLPSKAAELDAEFVAMRVAQALAVVPNSCNAFTPLKRVSPTTSQHTLTSDSLSTTSPPKLEKQRNTR